MPTCSTMVGRPPPAIALARTIQVPVALGRPRRREFVLARHRVYHPAPGDGEIGEAAATLSWRDSASGAPAGRPQSSARAARPCLVRAGPGAPLHLVQATLGHADLK